MKSKKLIESLDSWLGTTPPDYFGSEDADFAGGGDGGGSGGSRGDGGDALLPWGRRRKAKNSRCKNDDRIVLNHIMKFMAS